MGQHDRSRGANDARNGEFMERGSQKISSECGQEETGHPVVLYDLAAQRIDELAGKPRPANDVFSKLRSDFRAVAPRGTFIFVRSQRLLFSPIFVPSEPGRRSRKLKMAE